MMKFTVKGIIRTFELEEIYLFYYLIDAGEFSYSNDTYSLNHHERLILKDILQYFFIAIAIATLIKWYLFT